MKLSILVGKIFFLCIIIHYVTGKRVMFISINGYSHVMDASRIAEKLAAYGHETYIIKPKEITIDANETVRVIEYESEIENLLNKFNYQNYCNDHSCGKTIDMKSFEETMELLKLSCRGILRNKELLETIRKYKFDYAVIDGTSVCLYAIPKQLGIPYSTTIAVDDMYNTDATGVMFGSYFINLLRKDKIEMKNFIFRFTNFLNNLRFRRMLTKLYEEKDGANTSPSYSLSDFLKMERESDAWIITRSIMFSYIRCKSPNVFFVGGIMSRIGPVPDLFVRLIKQRRQGIIVVSFGSILTLNNEKILQQMFDLFAEYNEYTFIWKIKVDNGHLRIPQNVYIFDWIPQHALLKYAKLLITHGGIHSLQEATYNGVPAIIMPAFGDQVSNALTAADKKVALIANFGDIIELRYAMHKILLENYLENSTKGLSMRMRDLEPDPPARAAFILNHIIKYGSSHLRFDTMGLNAPQLLLYDVIIFTALFVILLFEFNVCLCLLAFSKVVRFFRHN